MKKRVIAFVITGFFLILGITVSSAFAKSKSPWVEKSDVNMYMLIKDGYRIVDTNFVLGGMGTRRTSPVEVVYLMKEDQLFRCVTVERDRRKSEHKCELCTDPTVITVSEANAEANAAIKNSYTSAQAYFQDFPNAIMDVEKMMQAGLRKPENVRITVSGNYSSLRITTTHVKGDKIYSTDSSGEITVKSK